MRASITRLIYLRSNWCIWHFPWG